MYQLMTVTVSGIAVVSQSISGLHGRDLLLHVWCLFVDDRYVIYLVSVDADIDDKQFVYFGLKHFLERMTNH